MIIPEAAKKSERNKSYLKPFAVQQYSLLDGWELIYLYHGDTTKTLYAFASLEEAKQQIIEELLELELEVAEGDSAEASRLHEYRILNLISGEVEEVREDEVWPNGMAELRRAFVEASLVEDPEETARLAGEMPPEDLALAQKEAAAAGQAGARR